MSLESAHTWFFESLSHHYPDRLVITLVEGIKLPEREPVEVIESKTIIGPYFPVRVLDTSRCISVTFDDVLSYQVVDESYSAPRTEIVGSTFSGPVRECDQLEYQKYIERDSLVSQLRTGEYRSYFIWTEDQTFFVIAASPPYVEVLKRKPDLSIERGNTYAAE